MTTFTSPQASREAIAALFTAYTGSGQPLQQVFSNWPKTKEAKGISPFIMVVDEFTEQQMNTQNVNRTRFGFVVAAFVLCAKESDGTINRADALDELGNINRVIRQVIRGGVGASSNWDNLGFEGRAQVENFNFDGLLYVTQPFVVVARLPRGQT